MEHFFDLPVIYKDEELNLRARLVTFGYSYKFYIVVDKFELEVERDDQMNFRVLNYDTDVKIDIVLLEAIITSLEKLSQ